MSTVTAESPAARWVIAVLSVVVFAAVMIVLYDEVLQALERAEDWQTRGLGAAYHIPIVNEIFGAPHGRGL